MPDGSNFPNTLTPAAGRASVTLRKRARRSSNRPVTPADLAAAEFAPCDEAALIEAIGPVREWIEQSGRDFGIMRFAAAAASVGHELATDIARQELDAMREMAENFIVVRDRYRGLAEMLDIAIIRTMVGIARSTHAGIGDLA